MAFKLNKENKMLYEYLINSVFLKYIDEAKGMKTRFNDETYAYYLHFAEDLIKNLNDTYIGFLEMFIPLEKLKKIDCYEALGDKRDLLAHYRYHCYEYIPSGTPAKGTYKLLSCKEQNDKAKKYIHFDFSTKNPKNFKEV